MTYGINYRIEYQFQHVDAAEPLVNVWATEAGLAIGAQEVASATNEVATVHDVLKQLVLAGCIVTTDTAHC